MGAQPLFRPLVLELKRCSSRKTPRYAPKLRYRRLIEGEIHQQFSCGVDRKRCARGLLKWPLTC